MTVIARNSNFAIINSAFGTPVDPFTTGRGVNARSLSLPLGKREHIRDAELAGQPLHTIVTPGNYEPTALTFETPFAVNGLPLKEVIRAALGNYAFALDTPDVGGNLHTISLDPVVEPLLFFTAGWNEGAENIQAEDLAVESVEFKLDGHFWVAVNTRGTKSIVSAYSDATTYTAPVEYFTMNNSANYFRLAPFSQATLGAPDNQKIKNISMLFQRNLANLDPTGGTDKISAIIDATEFTCDITLEYPTKSDICTSARAGHQAATKYMLEVYLKGSLISGSAYYSAKFQFPCLTIDETATVWDSGKGTTLKLKLQGTATAPTAMPGITVPTIKLVSIDTSIAY